ncbi:MAG: ABC transporter permease [Candidatus Altiarchaeota archaeon]
MHKEGTRKIDLIAPAVMFALFVISWESIDFVLEIREVILPNPHEILSSMVGNFPLLLEDTSITLVESVLGFLIGSLTGIFLASLFFFSSLMHRSLYPYAIALKATPLYAIAPILVIWFGSDMSSKIVMSALVSFFPVLVNTYKGFMSVSPEGLDLFRSFGASSWQVFLKLHFPNSLPYIFPSLKIASTLAVVGATIAEFTGSSRGIGHLIVNSSYYLDTSLMFAAITMISLGGILFYYAIEYFENKIVVWQKNEY